MGKETVGNMSFKLGRGVGVNRPNDLLAHQTFFVDKHAKNLEEKLIKCETSKNEFAFYS